MSGGRQPLPFGHSADAAVDIEGLSVGVLAILTLVNLVMPFDSS